MTLSRRLQLISVLTILLSSLVSHSFASSHADLVLSNEDKDWINKHPSITIAFDGYFPPYSFLTDDGKLEGFSVDLFKYIGEQTGIEFKTSTSHTWKALYEEAKTKQVDVVATMVNRKERSQWFSFTAPYIEKSLVIITPANNQEINRKADLESKTIALVKDYQYAKRIIEEYPSVTPHWVDTIQDALTAVSLGDADAAVAFLGAGHFYRTKYLLTNLKYAALYDKNGSPESVAVRNDWPELANIIDKAIHSISEAELQALREKWLPVEYLDSIVEVALTKDELQWIKDHPKIRLGVDPEFAPFEYIENEQYKGMASDYIRLLNQRLNINMEVVENLTWKQVTEKARTYDVDVLPAVGKTAERQTFLNYTSPYLSFHRVIVAQTDAPFIVNLNDLQGKRVAVQANSSHYGYIKENSTLTPVAYKTLKEALLALSGGEVDAFVGNVASTSYWIRKLNLTNLKVAAPVSKEVQSLHFAIRKDWPELVSIIQKGLDSITTGQQRAISEKWTSIEYGYELDVNLIWRIVTAVLLLFASIMLWNIMLKKKVKEQTELILHSAQFDDLTNLPNRFLIQERLNKKIAAASRKHSKIAMLSIDIDEFKKINDSYGHFAGDEILRDVSERLSTILKEGDSLGRLGGDQFLVTLDDYKDRETICSIAVKITELFKDAFSTENGQFILTASVGIAIFPNDGSSSDELLKNADIATHHSKSIAPGSYAFYTAHQNERIARDLKLEEELRTALKKHELRVFYQPKFDARSKEIVGLEALLRWTSPKRGNVSPIEFIPIAEKSGLIEPIGFFVLEQALKDLTTFQKYTNKHLSMAVNISPVQFRTTSLDEQINELICQTGIRTEQLEIEITEGILMSSDARTEAILNNLGGMGVKLAMDDFGTGYSSMSNLRKFKFDTLKIDREFIKSIPSSEPDCQLVSSSILMAHGLGMTVVAEGVETEEQNRYLVQHQCDLIQGFLYSKAVPASEIIERLKPK